MKISPAVRAPVSTQYDHGFKTSSAESFNHFKLKFEVVQSGSIVQNSGSKHDMVQSGSTSSMV